MTELAPPNFVERLKRYLDDVQKAGSEAGKAFLFLEFVRGVFKQLDMDYLEKLYPELEKFIKFRSKTLMVRGRPDAFLGNIIIEFKMKLDKESLDEAENELRKYVAILWSRQGKHRVPYITVASDGLNFTVHRPRTTAPTIEEVPPESVILQSIDKLDLHKTRSGHAFVWLDRYMLYHTLRPATAEGFSKEFGLDMPAYKEAFNLLKEEWGQIRETTLYDQWASFLRIVYGSSVESEDLFIKHTYLATLAKLLAYASFSGGALPVSDDQLIEILEGRIFSEKWGVHNFLEEDFFSWVVEREEGLKVTRMILERVATYDLSTVSEDILKTLYQELVDPDARHDLGEYYTPDWLAEYMTEKVLSKHAVEQVLDPACGSGTFLAAVIRAKNRLLDKQLDRTALVEHIFSSVRGVDIHPLAVILARTTYLVSLGTDLLNARKGTIAVPVYMANSIKLPEENVEIYNQLEVYKVEADGKILRIPRTIVEDPNLTDIAVETIKEYSKLIAAGQKHSKETFQNVLFLSLPTLATFENAKAMAVVLYETAEKIAELIQAKPKRDAVWGFILKNIYKPLFLKQQKFDILIGNPPWLAYRYVESVDYQAFLKKMIQDEYSLLTEAPELIPNMELASLFLVRTCDLYLKEKGTIAFVMPRGIFTADQHSGFRQEAFATKVRLKLIKLLDLRVKPLFNVPACVVFARLGERTSWPIDGEIIEGNLPAKNVKFNEAQRLLEINPTRFFLSKIGGRSFITEGEVYEIEGLRSFYYEKFQRGADLYPRPFYFVEIQRHPIFGLNPHRPYFKTSSRAELGAKEEYEGVSIDGVLESDFVYATLTSTEIVPFAHLTTPILVLPVEIVNQKFRIMRSQEAAQRGFVGASEWFKKVEEIWTKRRGEKAEKATIYEWLDYRRKLTNQNPTKPFKVLYTTSAKDVASCLIDLRSPLTVTLHETRISIKGFVADTKTYYYETESANEAFFLSAILNSPFVNAIIKPMQSRGQFGERDIHKKILEIPIPRYSHRNPKHRRLAELGKECNDTAREQLVQLTPKYRSIAKIRESIRNILSDRLQEIDGLVKEIIAETSKSRELLKNYLT